MAKFRVEKNKDFTIMSNHHLRNKDLSLKAKGLLSQMLSLPEDWDYTLRGLVAINKEKLEAIRTAVLELEQQGYITRQQKREPGGRLSNIEYTIYERPQHRLPRVDASNAAPPPCLDFPNTEKPNTEKPYTEKPYTENPTQLNTKELSTNKQSTNQSITQSIKQKEGMNERNYPLSWYREKFRQQIEYEVLCEESSRDLLDEIIETMLEPFSVRQDTMSIGKEVYSTAAVRDRMKQIRASHIEQVMDTFSINAGNIESPRKYLLALLYNAPRQTNHQYKNMVGG